MGFCTAEEYERFMGDVNEFEEMVVGSGIILLKYWIHVSAEEQEKRFEERATNPFKRWKLSALDLEGRRRWAAFTQARDRMLDETDTEHAPWSIVDGDSKKKARLNVIHSILNEVPYEFNEEAFAAIKLPPRPTPQEAGYDERTLEQSNMVKNYY
jgi:polyphosphate kinase 2 (PPK2 family)